MYRFVPLIAIVFLATQANAVRLFADEISFVAVPGYSTGANINALAGPLFSSDLDSVDIAGAGMATASASKDGNFATQTSVVELDYSAGPAFIDSLYESPFSRTAILDHRASAESIFHFTVDTVAEYGMDGFFAAVDETSTTVPGNVELEMELLEFDSFGSGAPPPVTLFYSYQQSTTGIDEAFVAGGLDGDTTNVLEGSLMGILDPGKFYRYRTLVTINAIDLDGTGPLLPTDGGASAMGGTLLTVSGVASIPEPAFVGPLMIGFLMAASSRKRNTAG